MLGVKIMQLISGDARLFYTKSTGLYTLRLVEGQVTQGMVVPMTCSTGVGPAKLESAFPLLLVGYTLVL